MIEMLRKINTSRAVRTMQELFPEEYDFYPRSWILPEEFQLFCAQAGSQQRWCTKVGAELREPAEPNWKRFSTLAAVHSNKPLINLN